MQYAQIAQQAAGDSMQLAGAILGAGAADRRKKKIEQIGLTPGIDIPTMYSQATSAGMSGLPAASRLASGYNASASADLQAALETAIPGYGKLQADRVGQVGAMVRGEIPDDVSRQVFRKGAAKSLEGGYGGTEFGRNLVARDLGLTSLDIIGRGLSGASDLVTSTPLPRMTQVSDILNLSGKDVTSLRSNERQLAMSIALQAAGAPGSQDVWAKALTDKGSQMSSSSGGGMGGMDIGGMIGGGGGGGGI